MIERNSQRIDATGKEAKFAKFALLGDFSEAVQSLASGEVDVGAAMMKHWLKVQIGLTQELQQATSCFVKTKVLAHYIQVYNHEDE